MTKFTMGNTAGKGRKPGSVNVATAEVRSLAARLLSSAKYRRNFRQRLESGALAPPLEALMWAYAYGRPPADPPEPLASIPAEPAPLSFSPRSLRVVVMTRRGSGEPVEWQRNYSFLSDSPTYLFVEHLPGWHGSKTVAGDLWVLPKLAGRGAADYPSTIRTW